MATIDSNIALGVKPIQIENPMNQYAALSQLQANQNQNALAQYQLAASKRAEESQNIQNQLYAKHYNPETGQVNKQGLMADLAAQNQGVLIPKLQAQFTEEEHKQNVNKEVLARTSGLEYKQKMEKFNKAISHIGALNTPQEALASIKESLAKGDIDQTKADSLIQSLNNTPKFNDWQKNLVMGILDAKDQFHVKNQEKTLSETIRHNNRTEGIQQQNVNIQGGQLNLAQQKFAFETNPEKVGVIAEAKKTGELNATDKLAKTKTIEGANQILKDIKYNPKTKENDVSKLIDISTGSYLGKAYDIGGRIFGSSTEGSKAIAELKTIESKITTDLLGGKLGSGISNADRDFIQQQVGLIGDATLPTGDRKAAWSRVVNRLADISSKNSATTVIVPPAGFVPD